MYNWIEVLGVHLWQCLAKKGNQEPLYKILSNDILRITDSKRFFWKKKIEQTLSSKITDISFRIYSSYHPVDVRCWFLFLYAFYIWKKNLVEQWSWIYALVRNWECSWKLKKQNYLYIYMYQLCTQILCKFFLV